MAEISVCLYKNGNEPSVLDWRETFNKLTCKAKEKEEENNPRKGTFRRILPFTFGGMLVAVAPFLIYPGIVGDMIPAFSTSHAFADTGGEMMQTQGRESEGWEALIQKVRWVADYLMSGVIIFAGAAWMFNNRTKAIETLLSAGIGYTILTRHEEIKSFLTFF